jgi:membrane fusion protein, multidrug efflux system
MSFTFPIEVAEIAAKGGQKVKKGDLLIRGRDEEYIAQRDLQRTQAESDLEIQKAQAALDQANVEFEGWRQLKERKQAGSDLEFERARTLLEARTVDLAIARLQKEQAGIQLRIREAQLDRVWLKAPFDGVVDIVTVEVGEVKRETEPVVRVVATDPLWIDAYMPTDQTMTLGSKAGDPAWAVLEVPGRPAVYVGKVIEVGAAADFGSATRRIRIELPNAGEWPAGVGAWVRLTPPEGDWAGRVTDQRKAAAR